MTDLGVSPVAPGEAHARRDVAVHPGDQRIALPPGETRIDFVEGEARHLGTDTVITSDITSIGQTQQVGDESEQNQQDQNVMRALLAFCDVGCTLKVAGSEIPLDPCNYFPIQRRSFQQITITTKLPAQCYLIASARSKPFADIVSKAAHTNRIGTYSGTPDSYDPVPFEAPGTFGNADFGSEARHPALHVQEFGSRTWTVENTGANKAEVRIVAKATHDGPFVDVEPSQQPVAVASGAKETLTLNNDAWHVAKLEVRNTTTGNSVSLESHYAGVNA